MDFDLLVAQKAPFPGFGEIIQNSRGLEEGLHKAAAQVREQIRNVFGAKLDSPPIASKELDDIIQELWDPEADNVELFTRDLGLLLTRVARRGVDIPINRQCHSFVDFLVRSRSRSVSFP